MKKRALFFVVLLLLLSTAVAMGESAAEWSDAPVIKKAYELEAGKLYLEWQGNASGYHVYMDGKRVANVIVNNAVISITKGSHMICVYPVNDINKESDVDIGVTAGNNFSIDLGLDLSALGLNKLVAGNPSDMLSIDYTPNLISGAVPDQLEAETDLEDRVQLSFTDRYNADEYLITIKNRKDVNYVRFIALSDASIPFIIKEKSTVTLILDHDFLEKQGCMIPELNDKYTFSVQLRKYAVNMINGEKETMIIHESKVSKEYSYIPTALWRTPPVITYASQTSDGQITIRWDHAAVGHGCEYVISKINKTLGIRRGEEEWGTTTENEYVVYDLLNGSYTISVTPMFHGEKGEASSEVKVSIRNEWVISPALVCEQVGENTVKLTWSAAENAETYHITVYAGNSNSLLRFVDLDYRKYAEFDVPGGRGIIEYIYYCDKEYNADAGLKLKFEIVGIRHAADGTEQRSGTSSQSITIR